MDFVNAFALILVINNGSIATQHFQNESLCLRAMSQIKHLGVQIPFRNRVILATCVQVTDYEQLMEDE